MRIATMFVNSSASKFVADRWNENDKIVNRRLHALCYPCNELFSAFFWVKISGQEIGHNRFQLASIIQR